MITYADLFLKALQVLTGERARQISAQRDQRDRIADYLLRISDALKEAADGFSSNQSPWHVSRELAIQVGHLLEVIGDAFEDKDFVSGLREELHRAVCSDYLLLNISDQHCLADGIVIRPKGHEWGGWKDNPIVRFTKKEAEDLLAEEVRKLQEASGLFRAASHRLRATTG
jgi:hypothetical protein